MAPYNSCAVPYAANLRTYSPSHKEQLLHTLPPSQSGTSGFIAKCLRASEPGVKVVCSLYDPRFPAPYQLPYPVSSCIPIMLLR